jgi:hypothetical protein
MQYQSQMPKLGRIYTSLASPIHTAVVDLVAMPLTQGVTCLYNEDSEVSDISNTNLLKNIFFS